MKPAFGEIVEGASKECVFFEGRFYCTCGKSYKHKESWYSHKKYECGVEPRFQCSECPYRAKQKQHLKSHVYLKHKKKLMDPSGGADIGMGLSLKELLQWKQGK